MRGFSPGESHQQKICDEDHRKSENKIVQPDAMRLNKTYLAQRFLGANQGNFSNLIKDIHSDVIPAYGRPLLLLYKEGKALHRGRDCQYSSRNSGKS